MIARIIFTILLINLSINIVCAEEFLLTVTPVNKFTTADKNILEGDTIEFRIIEDLERFQKDEIITGTIISYEPNGFFGQKANIVLGNFRTSNGQNIKGKMYIGGGEHKTLQDFCNFSDIILGGYIRGGEVVLKPQKSNLSFFVEE